MKKEQQWTNLELISLIAYIVKALAEAKGYPSYPKEEEVELVLQGLYIVNEAIKEEQDG